MFETAKVVEVEQALFRVEEAAEYLRIGRTTMYALLKNRVIPSFRVGALRIVRKTELDAYATLKLEEEA